jgi:hypothetical protein
MKFPYRRGRAVEERFWEKVAVGKSWTLCWEWLGSKDGSGYGMLSVAGATQRAHRFSWVLTRGPIPKGIQVLHHCDNPGCVNPAHLWLGTNADNVHDKMIKHRESRGEAHGRTCRIPKQTHHPKKLTAEKVLQIRALYAEGGITMPDIARRYNINDGTVYQIIKKQIWRHI